MMSNALTAARAASSRADGISWMVPKSAGTVMPSALLSRWASVPGASGAERSGSTTSGGMMPAAWSCSSALPTMGKTSSVT